MRSPVASVVAAALTLIPFAAYAQQPPPDTVTQVNRQRIKPGMVQQYEAGRKKHMAWHKAQKDPWTWTVWEVTTGPDTGAYVIATTEHSWADFDTWQAKMGEADSADAQAAMGAAQEDVDTTYWTQLNAISRMPPPDQRLPLLTLTIFQVKPGSDTAFMAGIGKINAALEAAKFPAHTVWYRLSSGGPAPAYAVVSPRANMAALSQSVAAALGAQADTLLKPVLDNVTSITTELLQRRDDLSYSAQSK